ncbi:MAG TPA: MBL fold metallo-hydrolase [Candidatus Deferrimicrobiaceae bacterium]|nr:MBL fold metallo-hydrolase [Candidatus Deferrimicrobiaceae bacterium]
MNSGFGVRPLRSGSSGNLTLVEYGGTILLIDAGLPSQRGLAQALSEAGITWEDIDALLVSHLHGDHIHPSAVACCARHEVPILLHEKNVRPFSRRILSRSPRSGPVCTFDSKEFSVGAIRVRPFPVPHDAEGLTCGFLLRGRSSEREIRVAVATDLGHGGNGLFEEFLDCNLILIESNYDGEMLAASPRQDRTRVDSEVGHLSNEQAGRFLARVMLESRTLPQAVVLCHLSADHNTPAKAVGTVRGILSRYGYGHVPVHAARRHGPSPRFSAVASPER